MGEREIPEWVREGAEVISYQMGGRGRTYGITYKIAKVLKNGNFKLEGSQDQYRPMGDRATKTGGDRWGSKFGVFPLTPEHRAAAIKERKLASAVKALNDEAERLQKLARSKNEAAILAEAARLPAPLVETGG